VLLHFSLHFCLTLKDFALNVKLSWYCYIVLPLQEKKTLLYIYPRTLTARTESTEQQNFLWRHPCCTCTGPPAAGSMTWPNCTQKNELECERAATADNSMSAANIQVGIFMCATNRRRENWNAFVPHIINCILLAGIAASKFRCTLHTKEIFAWADRGNMRCSVRPYYQWWHHPAGHPTFPFTRCPPVPCKARVGCRVPHALSVSVVDRLMSIKFSVAVQSRSGKEWSLLPIGETRPVCLIPWP
jgi:hypothetical protein